jgi:hypothetical protein
MQYAIMCVGVSIVRVIYTQPTTLTLIDTHVQHTQLICIPLNDIKHNVV